MMIQIFQILLVVAFATTAVLIYLGVTGGVGGVQVGAKLGIVLSAAAFVLWGLIAINAFEITATSGGQQFTRSYPSLAWVATAGALIAIYSLFQASIEEIKNTGGI
jgi:hypothetical protein